MRSTLVWLCATTALAALGCAGNSATPLAPALDQTPVAQVALGDGYSVGNSTVMPLGLYTIKLDTVGMSATVEPKEVRSAAAAGSDTYALCVSDFFPTPPMRITTITIAGATTLSLGYDIVHPFAAPSNLAGPATAANRADLGIQGSCVFLTDANIGTLPAARVFTSGGITAPPEVVQNAHGYMDPSDLFDMTGYTCNNFPFRVLVDELDLTCRSVTATGAVITSSGDKGNYAPGTGWQAANIGASNANWHGYGVLHQGQTVSSSLDLDMNFVDQYVAESGAFDLDVALLATYNDPRGGTNAAQKKANRLPSASGDVAAFFYDMENAVCPIERIVFDDQTWDTLDLAGATCQLECVSGYTAAACTVTVYSDEMFGPGASYSFTTSPTGSGTPSDPQAWVEGIPTAAILPGCPAGEYDVMVEITNTDAVDPIALQCDLSLVPGSTESHKKHTKTGHVTLLK